MTFYMKFNSKGNLKNDILSLSRNQKIIRNRKYERCVCVYIYTSRCIYVCTYTENKNI